jgi:hypothetical protein
MVVLIGSVIFPTTTTTEHHELAFRSDQVLIPLRPQRNILW